ncbi:MAG: glycosyl transferase [Candidatus Parcubacteria bacterium]|nr:glycosyl transferase [Candidatus Parcubacteria bacterium]
MKQKTISFVLPVYNEREGIQSFWKEISKTGRALQADSLESEFIFINDGSTDGTLDLLKDIAQEDPRVRVIEFSRNYGHQIAISAGIDFASGHAVIIMDTDLQDPPAVCLELVRAWREGAEVAFAKRRTRKDSFMKKLTARIFYRLLNAISDTHIPADVGDFRLLDRKAVEAMKMYREKHRFMRGISAHIGFRQKEILFDRDERTTGVTHYPFKKMLRFSTDAIMGFSSVPLRLISRLGMLVSFLSILGIIYVFVVKLLQPQQVVTGWPFVMVAIFFIGGIQLTVLGIIGGYIARIYAESQDRPLYIISAVHGADRS